MLSTVYIRFPLDPTPPLERASLLERLLSRSAGATSVVQWRDEAFRAIGGDPPAPSAAAAARYASNLGRGPVVAADIGVDQWVCLASPVHLVAGMRDVTLHAQGLLGLSASEAEALAIDFNQVFESSGVRLMAGESALLLIFDRPLSVALHEPEDVVGREVYEFQATGPDAPALRRLVSEMEMWLFEHAVNGLRVRRGALPITGLWPWGGGAVLESLPTVDGWCAGADPLFSAFDAQLEYPPESGAGVVVLRDSPGSLAWPEVERRWLAPALEALNARRIARVTLSCGTRQFTLTRAAWRRFWRRPSPWWESLGEAHGPQ